MEKIVLITGTFITGKGGVASYAHDFIQALKYKYVFTIVSGDNYTKDSKDNFSLYNIDLRNLSTSNAINLLTIIRNEKPDIIINSNAVLLSCVIPFIPKEIKIIAISHFVNGVLANIAGFNSRYSNSIITLSQYGKSYIENKFQIKNRNKISVVYNFIPENIDSNLIEEKKERKILKIVYPGGTQYYKSADIVYKSLLNLLDTSLDFEFYWLGNSNLMNHKIKFMKFDNLHKLLPNDSRIKHIGSTNRIVAIQLFSDSNIFILPSRGEGCPISLLEAMSCGTIPIISNAKHGSKEIIADKVSGLIIEGDNANLLSNCLIDIITHHDKYSEIYLNSIKRLEELLTKDIWTKKMVEIFDDVTRIRDHQNFSSTLFLKYSIFMRIILLKEFFLSRFLKLKNITNFLLIYFMKYHLHSKNKYQL